MNKKVKLIIEIIIFLVVFVGISLLYNHITAKDIHENISNVNSFDEVKEDKKVEILEIKGIDQFKNDVLSFEGTVLVDFYATWCGPCKMMSPIIEEIASEHGDVKFVKVDVDENQDLAIEYNVISIPTMFIIKNGEITKSFVGVVSKSDITEEL